MLAGAGAWSIVAGASAQGVVWQVPAYAGSTTTSGVGVAFVAPGTLFVTGNRSFVSPIDQNPHAIRWVPRFDLAGQPLDPQPGSIPQTSDDYVAAAIAADATGAYVMGNLSQGCVPNVGCTSVHGRLARYPASGGTDWIVDQPSPNTALTASAAGAFVAGGASATHYTPGGAFAWTQAFNTTGLTGARIEALASLAGSDVAAAGFAVDPLLNRVRPLFGILGPGSPDASRSRHQRRLHAHEKRCVREPVRRRLCADYPGDLRSDRKAQQFGNAYVIGFEPQLVMNGDLAPDGGGGAVAAGGSTTVRYAHDGAVLWLHDSGGIAETVESVVLASTGHVYVGGTTGLVPTPFVRKYGPNGNPIWETSLPGTALSELILAADSPIVMTDVPGSGARLFRLDPGPPGPSPATLIVQPLTSPPTIGGPLALSVIVSGPVAPTGTVRFGFGATASQFLDVALQSIDATSSRATLTIPALASAGSVIFNIRYLGDAANAPANLIVTLNVAAAAASVEVPTTGTAALVGLTLLVLALAARERRRRNV